MTKLIFKIFYIFEKVNNSFRMSYIAKGTFQSNLKFILENNLKTKKKKKKKIQ